MASFKHLPSGKWSARIRRRGHYVSRSFSTKGAAQRWARRVEDEIDADEYDGKREGETIGDLLKKYHAEVTHTKKGAARESRRIDQLLAHSVSQHLAAEFGPRHAREYRDSRLKEVSASTVKKELHLLSALMKHAIREWEMDVRNPIPDIRMPTAGSNGRDRRVSWKELRKLLEAAKSYKNRDFGDIVRIAYLTGMRQAEILSLAWEDIDFDRAIAVLRDTKNSEQRIVPLDHRVIRLLGRRKPADRRKKPKGRIFSYQSDGLRTVWHRITREIGITDLRFHDLRHEATSRFFEMGLSPLEVSSITGHKTLGMLRRYTHLDAAALATKIAQTRKKR
ncbi:integrase [Thiohalobacter sp. COW1]|uniref:site-specific integrase n=1 Tax=Thiohalobacter sp. COW1 TaxID=2795687 RepID=UPI00191532B8|nr:site-specific integrase [Thiohalobacter sp. COW1]BCO32071.1 integrase [Thiohalobacter sp. COW1]